MVGCKKYGSLCEPPFWKNGSRAGERRIDINFDGLSLAAPARGVRLPSEIEAGAGERRRRGGHQQWPSGRLGEKPIIIDIIDVFSLAAGNAGLDCHQRRVASSSGSASSIRRVLAGFTSSTSTAPRAILSSRPARIASRIAS